MLAKSYRVIPLAAVLAVAVGCKRDEIRVYVAPKEQPAQTTAGAAPESTPSTPAQRPRPSLAWTLPKGWEEVGESQMSLASFRIKDEVHEASVTITPLPGLSGQDEVVVNMWRQQVGQPPLTG